MHNIPCIITTYMIIILWCMWYQIWSVHDLRLPQICVVGPVSAGRSSFLSHLTALRQAMSMIYIVYSILICDIRMIYKYIIHFKHHKSWYMTYISCVSYHNSAWLHMRLSAPDASRSLPWRVALDRGWLHKLSSLMICAPATLAVAGSSAPALVSQIHTCIIF